MWSIMKNVDKDNHLLSLYHKSCQKSENYKNDDYLNSENRGDIAFLLENAL